MDDPIPDSWPPSEPETPRQTVPLFPLQNVFLFPGRLLKLHIFEQRYRQMVADLLDSHGRLVIGTVPEDSEEDLAGTPPVFPVAGLGEIGRHEQLPDGGFLIWLIGLTRVRLHEIESDRMYRKVESEILHEDAVEPEELATLRPPLCQAILDRLKQPDDERAELEKRLDSDLPLGHLADLLLQAMPLEQEVMQRLFAEMNPRRRAELALVEHGRVGPTPPPADTDED